MITSLTKQGEILKVENATKIMYLPETTFRGSYEVSTDEVTIYSVDTKQLAYDGPLAELLDTTTGIAFTIPSLEAFLALFGGGGGGGGVITGFNLETTQQLVLTELQGLGTETTQIDVLNELRNAKGSEIISTPLADVMVVPGSADVKTSIGSNYANGSSTIVDAIRTAGGIGSEVSAINTGERVSVDRLSAVIPNELASNVRFKFGDGTFTNAEFTVSFDSAGIFINNASLDVYDNVNYVNYPLVFPIPPTRDSIIAAQYIEVSNTFRIWVDGVLQVDIVVINIDLITNRVAVSTNINSSISGPKTSKFAIWQDTTTSQTSFLPTIAKGLTPISPTMVDKSGTITTANLSLSVVDANVSRKFLLIQNTSDTDMWINFGAPATVGGSSFKLTPNGNYEERATAGGYISKESVNVFCTAVGKEYAAKEA